MSEANEQRCPPQPLIKPVDRNQYLLRACHVERLIPENHPARDIWETVGRLDLSHFYEDIKSNTQQGGRSATDPRLLISLWIYAYSRGVGAAREVEQLCEYDPAFQWLTGMESVNYHTLSDFRGDWEESEEVFSQILAVLLAEGLITLEQVMQDGTKIGASASGNTFHREKSLQQHLEEARRQVAALADAEVVAAQSLRSQKAQKRAQRERVERLERAGQQLEKLREQKKTPEEKQAARVSFTDPEARVMKQSNGGFAPSYNAQLCTDAQHKLILDAHLTQAGNDFEQLQPALERLQARFDRKPKQMVVDDGYVSRENVESAATQGVDLLGGMPDNAAKAHPEDTRFPAQLFVYDPQQNQFVCPAGKVLAYEGKQNKDGLTYYKYKAQQQDCQSCPQKAQCCPKNEKHGRSVVRSEETSAMIKFRQKMATEEAKAQYRKRSEVAEFPHAWIKSKLGLWQFHVRGLLKSQAELLWACCTYNVLQWIRIRKKRPEPTPLPST